MEPSLPTAEALAVAGDLIVAVGGVDEVMRSSGPATRVIDLDGRTLMPGFVDPHDHLHNAVFHGQGSELGITTYAEAEELLLSVGTTTLGNANVWPGAFEAFADFAAAEGLRIRTSLYLGYNDVCGSRWPDDWYRMYLDGDPLAEPRVVGIKVFVDSASCGGPALSVPAGDPFGTLHVDVAELTTILAAAREGQYQVAMQTSGDRAIDTAFEALDAARGGGLDGNHHRMEHNRIIRPDQLAMFGTRPVVPVVDGQTATCEMLDGAEWSGLLDDSGPSAGLRPWFDPWRALLDANTDLRLAWLSAAPRLTHVPLVHLWSLTTRKAQRNDGSVCEPPRWLAASAVTVEEALRMMTIHGAQALQMDDFVGSLRIGKLADLVVLSDSPLEVKVDDILGIRVLMTMVGGTVESCLPGHEAVCPR